MPAADRRTPGELLAENDELSRLLLLEVNGDRAPAMLRAFPTLVESAAQLWSALPRPGHPEWPGADPMFRLVAIARGIDRAGAAGLWPGAGVTDERLLIMARNFTQAAELIDNPIQGSQSTHGTGEWVGRAEVRAQMLHVLYVAAHGVTVALTEHAAVMTEQLRRDSLRKTPGPIRHDRGEPDAARAMISRLDVLEQFVGRYLFDSAGGHLGGANRLPMSVADRLASALAVWDIQAHRSLAAHPTPANLACVARVQAVIAATSGVVAEAATQTSGNNRAATERFTTLIDRSQLAWTRAANRWSELITPAARTDPKLLGAASELRAALTAVTHDQTSWAAAEVIASRIHLPTAVSQLQLATAAAIDIAHLTRDIALTDPTLTAPARAIAMRTQADVEQAIDQGESRYLGVDWVTAGDIRTNRIIPLPDPTRRGLVDNAEQVIAAAGQGAAAAAALAPLGRADHDQPSAATRSRQGAMPSPPIQSAQRRGPSR